MKIQVFALTVMAGFSISCSSEAQPTEDRTDSVDATLADKKTGLAIDGGPSEGTYRVTGPDGNSIIQEIREDGTYSSMVDGREVVAGTWVQKSQTVFCTTPEMVGAAQECTDEKITEDGTWQAVDRNTGAIFTIERLVEF